MMSDELLLTIAAWSGAIVGVVAAIKALFWLGRTSLIPAWSQTRRVASAILRLAAIGDEQSWPNGSTDLPTFLDSMHETSKSNSRQIVKLLEFHSHELVDAEAGIAEDDWDQPHGTPV